MEVKQAVEALFEKKAFAAVGRERYETSYEVSDGNNSNRLKDT